MTQIATTLPDVLVGPLLRRLSPSRLILWLVATRPPTMQLVLNPEQEEQQTHALDNAHQCVAIGSACLYSLYRPFAAHRAAHRPPHCLRPAGTKH